MSRRILGICSALAVSIVVLSVSGFAQAAPLGGIRQGTWAGTSTNMTGTFNYGRVSFKVGRGVITNFRIEAVTVSGCGGYKNILMPKLTIKGNKISGSYTPIPGIDDVVIVTGTFSGGAIKGTFTEGPTCSGAGRFIARPA